MRGLFYIKPFTVDFLRDCFGQQRNGLTFSCVCKEEWGGGGFCGRLCQWASSQLRPSPQSAFSCTLRVYAFSIS